MNAAEPAASEISEIHSKSAQIETVKKPEKISNITEPPEKETAAMSTEELLKMIPTKVNMNPIEGSPEPVKLKPAKIYASEKSEEKAEKIETKNGLASITPLPAETKTTETTAQSVVSAPQNQTKPLIIASASDALTKEIPKAPEIKKEPPTMIVASNEKPPIQSKQENVSVLMPIQSGEKAVADPLKTKSEAVVAAEPKEIKPSSVPALMPAKTVAPSTVPEQEAQKEPEKTVAASAMPEPLVNKEQAAKEAALKAEVDKKKAEETVAQTAQKASQDAALKKIQIWEAKEGASLKKTLQKWSDQVQVPLVWNSEENYKLKMDVYVSGTFENALKTLFSMGVKNPPQRSLQHGEKYELVISDG